MSCVFYASTIYLIFYILISPYIALFYSSSGCQKAVKFTNKNRGDGAQNAVPSISYVALSSLPTMGVHDYLPPDNEIRRYYTSQQPHSTLSSNTFSSHLEFFYHIPNRYVD